MIIMLWAIVALLLVCHFCCANGASSFTRPWHMMEMSELGHVPITASSYAGTTTNIDVIGDANGDGAKDVLFQFYDGTDGTAVLIMGPISNLTGVAVDTCVTSHGTEDNPHDVSCTEFTSSDSADNFPLSTGSNYGYDADNDGCDEIILAAALADWPEVGRTDNGRVYVVFGFSGAWPATFDLSTLDGTNGYIFYGLNDGDMAGFAATNGGDYGNDKFSGDFFGGDTMIVGAPGVNSNAGAVYMVYHQVDRTEIMDMITTTVTMEIWGAGGGGGEQFLPSSQGRGGGGGYQTCTFEITAGTELTIIVGEGGSSINSGIGTQPFGGGGAVPTATQYSGQGGGYSGVFIDPTLNHGNVLCIAGAGGGGGDQLSYGGDKFINGGYGGGTNGGSANQNPPSENYGRGGTSIAGGVGGQAGVNNGAALQGGDGVSSGGGGGGGYWGGGGGEQYEGGGGGSSFVNTLATGYTSGSTQQGSGKNPGNSASEWLSGHATGGEAQNPGTHGLVVLHIQNQDSIVFEYTGSPQSYFVDKRPNKYITWYGNTPGDQFGYVLMGGSDQNGDKRDELVVSAPFSGGFEGAHFQAGTVYVIFGKIEVEQYFTKQRIYDYPEVVANRTGLDGNLGTGDDGQTWVMPCYGGEDGAMAGIALETRANLNDDSFDEVVIGTMKNKVFILWGHHAASWPMYLVLDERISVNNGGIIVYSNDPNDFLGASLTSGRFDDDNIDDVMIGNPNGDGYRNGDGTNRGEVIVIRGRELTSTWESWYHMDIEETWIMKRTYYAPAGDNEEHGLNLAAADFNGDGRDDIIVGAIDGKATLMYSAAPSIFCSALSSPSYGETSCNDLQANYSVGSTCTTTCFDGYSLNKGASATSTCRTTGVWDAVPTCVPQSGGAIYNLANTADATFSNNDNNLATADLAGVGDVNGDGFDDLMYTASNEVDNAYGFLVFGRSDFSTLPVPFLKDTELSSEDLVKFEIGTVTAVELTHHIAVASAGDIDGDTFGDFVLGASYNGEDCAVLVYGRDSDGWNFVGTNFGTDDINGAGAADNGAIFCRNPGDQVGYAVSSLGGFLNGAGVLIGAPNSDGPSAQAGCGSVYAVNSDTSKVFQDMMDLDTMVSVTAVSYHGAAAGDMLGYSVDGDFDFNGDSVSDIVMGAPGHTSSTGAAYVVYGGSVILQENADVSGVGGSSFVGATAGDMLGSKVVGAGDTNGDLYDDLLLIAIGGQGDNDGGDLVGEVYLIFGTDSVLTENVASYIDNSFTTGYVIYGLQDRHMLGHAAAGKGDLNGDGFADFVVSSPYYTSKLGRKQGASFVWEGQNFEWNPINSLGIWDHASQYNGEEAHAQGGGAVAYVGDVNGDGLNDLGFTEIAGGMVSIQFGTVWCPVIPAPPFGSTTCENYPTNPTNGNLKCTPSCLDGYSLEYEGDYTCGTDSQWTYDNNGTIIPAPVPQCNINYCEPLSHPVNGTSGCPVDPTDARTNALTCGFSCIDGTAIYFETDLCFSDPCEHGGVCTAIGRDDFVCDCTGTGWEGDTCWREIDDCASGPCPSDSLCVDEWNGYDCICTEDMTFETLLNCSVQVASEDWPRADNSTFSVPQTHLNKQRVESICQYDGQWDYDAPTCRDVDDCESSPCLNKGRCTDTGILSFECDCDNTGFEGDICDQDVDDCEFRYENVTDANNVTTLELFSVCQNGGVCTDTGKNLYECNCTDTGWTGPTCQYQVYECLQYEDVLVGYENETIVDNVTNTATIVSTPIYEEQIVNPCMNEASCVDAQNNFTCNCKSGYQGWLCDKDVDDCASSPCLNGGTCVDIGRNEFMCHCDDDTGYIGDICDEKRDECLSSPCANGGTCVPLGILDFICACTRAEWEGDLCEIAIPQESSSSSTVESTSSVQDEDQLGGGDGDDDGTGAEEAGGLFGGGNDMLTYGIMAIIIIPMLAFGAWKIKQTEKAEEEENAIAAPSIPGMSLLQDAIPGGSALGAAAGAAFKAKKTVQSAGRRRKGSANPRKSKSSRKSHKSKSSRKSRKSKYIEEDLSMSEGGDEEAPMPGRPDSGSDESGSD